MRTLTTREQEIMDDETKTIEQKMKALRMLSPTFWTVDELSERFNFSKFTIQKLFAPESN